MNIFKNHKYKNYVSDYLVTLFICICLYAGLLRNFVIFDNSENTVGGYENWNT